MTLMRIECLLLDEAACLLIDAASRTSFKATFTICDEL